ncbi:MAG: hypothetical protein R3D30_03960 [Hyphomicrobiales bacterium]
MTAGAANDTLIGGAGNDTLTGGGGADLLPAALGWTHLFIPRRASPRARPMTPSQT